MQNKPFRNISAQKDCLQKVEVLLFGDNSFFLQLLRIILKEVKIKNNGDTPKHLCINTMFVENLIDIRSTTWNLLRQPSCRQAPFFQFFLD